MSVALCLQQFDVLLDHFNKRLEAGQNVAFALGFEGDDVVLQLDCLCL